MDGPWKSFMMTNVLLMNHMYGWVKEGVPPKSDSINAVAFKCLLLMGR